MPTRYQRGFTLIELSIVLVIIGLIVGGVLVGRDLIAAAAVRAQISQIEKYNQAVNAFRGKYNCLPGDCPNATNFLSISWGAWGGTSSANGDGNDMIQDVGYSAAFPYPITMQGEPPVVFVHLFTAGLTDCCSGAGLGLFYTTATPAGTAYPATKIGSGGFMAMNIEGRNGWWLGMGSRVPSAPCGGGNIPDYLVMQAAGPCTTTGGGLFTPMQTQAMDAKVDDGFPATGNVYPATVNGGDNRVRPMTTFWGTGYNCVTNTTPLAYDLSNGQTKCNMFFKMQ